MTSAADARRVEAVRAFNRDYTRVAGLLTENLLETRHSLTEARVIFELDRGSELSMVELRGRIGLDAGYLSRLVSRLQKHGLIEKRRSADDGRVQLLRLTEAGARERATLDERSALEVGRLLERVDEAGRDELVGAMRAITAALGERELDPEIVLRPLRSGEIGWILERHGVLFSREYGWGLGFERLVAGVLAEFAERRDEPGFGGWIAEVDGRRAGSILCMDAGHGVAKLRLLLVEPDARGLRLGTRLVEECISFARRAGYSELRLWTMDVLVHARPIYERAGFELVDSEPHTMFGPEINGQTWRLALRE